MERPQPSADHTVDGKYDMRGVGVTCRKFGVTFLKVNSFSSNLDRDTIRPTC